MQFRQIAEICRRRGGSGCGGVSAMDGATELTGTYLQRPPQPDPPRHPSGNPLLLLLLLLLLRLPASGRHYRFGGCRAQPCRPPSYCGGSRVMWMSVGVDSGMFRSARICSRLKYRSLRVPYTCRGLAT